MQGFPIQQAKVQRPPLRAATLRRQRLVTWLDEHIHHRLIYVTAEAGYGKTTLLADFARRARVRVFWYLIDEGDANWVSFAHYLVAAGRELQPGFAPRTHELLAAPAGEMSREAVTAALIAELPTLTTASPGLFILDDYHLVDRVPEIRDLMKHVIARAPNRLTFALAGRRTPTVPISRLRSMGEVAELRSNDLRFQLDETEHLFRDTYGRDIDDDVIEDVTRRTEGWAASLQLVEAALRDRSPADTRTFVRGLTGAKGDLYDYLAEEVVADLDPLVQTFLMRTSILQLVDVQAAVVVTGYTDDEVEALISTTEHLGLLARRGQNAPEGHQYHPLVREFLEARLRAEERNEVVLALHKKVAVWYEDKSWRRAAFHYAAIDGASDIHRLLIANASSIMAAGEFDVAKGLVERLDTATIEPVFDLFRSRVELDRGALDVALRIATSACDQLIAAGSPLQFLALANAASVNMSVGNLSEAYEQSTLLANSAADPELLRIANATIGGLNASRAGSLFDYLTLLELMGREQRDNNQWHYLAITLLNASVIDQALGEPTSALAKASEAIELLADRSAIHALTAARSSRAWALAHMGSWDKATSEMQVAISAATGIARQEALGEAADLLTWYGDSAEAERTIDAAENAFPADRQLLELLEITRAELLCRQGRYDEAETAIRAHEVPHFSLETAHEARVRSLRARLGVLRGDLGARDAVDIGLQFCRAQGALFYAAILELLNGASLGRQAFDDTVAATLGRDPAYVSIAAEVIIRRLDQLSQATFDLLVMEVEKRPLRWRESLRAVLTGNGAFVVRAAGLLERIGVADDIPVLRALSRRTRGKGVGPNAGRALARRVAPRVFIEDQGRVRIRVGKFLLPDDDVRRRVLAILCFLVTRPGFAATRDEVVEALWSDADPTSGINSLNQTLYFLRRVLEPNYVEDFSANYVHHDSDVVWLDEELIDSRSRWCHRIVDRLSEAWSEDDVLALSREYRGKFALDFAYEEWSTSYREHLHAAYLECMERAIVDRVAKGEPAQAIALARRALQIDSDAEQLERLLVRAYHDAGSHAAVGEQYAHYAAFLRNELGIEPPDLQDLISGDFNLE